MTSEKILQQLGAELYILVLLGVFYLIFRYLLMRRPVLYSEFEKALFIAVALVIGVAFFFFVLR